MLTGKGKSFVEESEWDSAPFLVPVNATSIKWRDDMDSRNFQEISI
jgi:hypothetical protein